MNPDSVVVTGCGLVGPCGIGVASFKHAAEAQRQCLQPVPEHWHRLANVRSQVWAPLPAIDWSAVGFPKATCMQTDRVTRLGLLAAAEALGQSGLLARDEPARFSFKKPQALCGVKSDRIGIAVGCGLGGYQTLMNNDEVHRFRHLDQDLIDLREQAGPEATAQLERIAAALKHNRRFNPFTVAMTMPNATAARLAHYFQAAGPCRTPSLACASGTVAIGQAYDLIRSGRCDVVIAGGAEALVDHYGGSFRAFDEAGTLTAADTSDRFRNCPFDQASNGFLMAEGGAGIVILESTRHCQSRGGQALAELIGWSETTSQQQGIMATEASGLAMERCQLQALKMAGLRPQDIDYCNAHGTGTIANDSVEAALLSKLYKPEMITVSTKALLGHSLAASGAIEVIASVLALDQHFIHGHPDLTDPRPGPHIPTDCQYLEIDRALSVSAAFGGHNTALVMQRPGL